MQQKITFNGKTYERLEDMPPEIRQAYESVMQVLADQNQNGVPDLFEGTLGKQTNLARSTILYEGQAYERIDQLPPEAREKYERMMGQWVKAGRYTQYAETVDIAPTLAQVLNVRVPSASEGKVLTHALVAR